ncbi:beta-lactamase family protein [Candidatus Binatia bacterium]|jgi:D-alanyl-D-alanine carboxypeptidase|nr:beta-lactamase family protein [Candidatus Binatia bacterium]
MLLLSSPRSSSPATIGLPERRRGRRRLAFVLSAAIALSGCGDADESRRADSAISKAALQRVADDYRDACRSPGAAIGVRTPDGARHLAISGELAPDVPLAADSQYFAGSVTKLFVATLAYRLIEEGRLGRAEPVAAFLPSWPGGDRITVAMLLGHTSGMGDFGNDFSTELRDLVLGDLTRVYGYDEVLALVARVPPVAAPGERYHYSNANFIVLGAIVQRITGRTLGDGIEREIVQPLRLQRTLYGPDRLDALRAVIFHGLFDVTGTGTPIDIGGFPREAAFTVDPAGSGVVSTAPDLLTFVHTLFATARLLQPASRRSLASEVATISAGDLLLDGDFRIHGHGGAAPGAQTIVAHDEANDVTVVAWCNRLDPGEQELLASVLAQRAAFELAVQR